jgi:hypothetical protein
MKAPILQFNPNRPPAGPLSVAPTLRLALSPDERAMLELYRQLLPDTRAHYRESFGSWIACYGPHGDGTGSVGMTYQAFVESKGGVK